MRRERASEATGGAVVVFRGTLARPVAVRVISAARMEYWRFYVDESGSFEHAGDTVAVAGVLVPGPLSADQLLAKLQSVGDSLPWPLHAAHYNTPIYYALADEATSDRGRNPASTKAVAFLRKQDRARTDAALQRMRGPGNVRVSVLRALDKLLAQAPEAELEPWVYAALRSRKTAFWSALRRVITSLGRQGVMIVASGEARPAGAAQYWIEISGQFPSSRGAATASATRYLGLLGVCLERVGDLLRRRTGAHHVSLCVLERDIYSRGRVLQPADVDSTRELFAGRCAGTPSAARPASAATARST